MTVRVGINGFGRMGKLALRAAWSSEELEFVHINEIAGDAHCHAHLIEFDSIHGRWGEDKNISATGDFIHVDGKNISFSQHASPADVNWQDLDVDIVFECSGQFKSQDQLQAYFEQGVKKY